MNTENYDLNNNGKIDPDEREIMLEDRRRRMEDEDAKRDAQRNMTWFALSGMVLYPLAIVVASIAGLTTAAELIADIANIYVVSVSALVGAYFGFNAMGNRK
jgi:small-conductance mechanosensitive channel